MCWSDLTFEDLTSFNGRTGGWGRISPTAEKAEESATPCLRGSFLSQRLVVGRSDVDLQPSGRHSGLSPLSHYEVSLGLKRGLCIPPSTLNLLSASGKKRPTVIEKGRNDKYRTYWVTAPTLHVGGSGYWSLACWRGNSSSQQHPERPSNTFYG